MKPGDSESVYLILFISTLFLDWSMELMEVWSGCTEMSGVTVRRNFALGRREEKTRSEPKYISV